MTHLDDSARIDLAQRLCAACEPKNPSRSDHLGSLSMWAAYHLNAACIGLDLWLRTKATGEGASPGHGLVSTGVASASLVARGVHSALDLCAAVLNDIGGGQLTDYEQDLVSVRKLVKRGDLQLPASVERWLADLAGPELHLLTETRHALTHRTLSQGVRIALGEPTKSGVVLLVLGTNWEIDDLLPRLLRFGDAQFEGLVAAVSDNQ